MNNYYHIQLDYSTGTSKNFEVAAETSIHALRKITNRKTIMKDLFNGNLVNIKILSERKGGEK